MQGFKVNWKKWADVFILAIAVIIAYKLINNLNPIFEFISNFCRIITPFVIGFIIAYFLNPPCKLISKRISKLKVRFLARFANGISIFCVYITILLIVILSLNYVLPVIVKNIVDLVGIIPIYYKNAIDYLMGLEEDHFIKSIDWEPIIKSFSVQNAITRLSAGIDSVSGYAAILTSRIVNIFLSVIISIYFLSYKERLIKLLERMTKIFIKGDKFETVKASLNKVNQIFYAFISTQFLDACILGTLSIVVLSLIGCRYSVTLGLLLGMCNMIPYFGSIVATAVTVVITIFTNGINTALITGIALLVLQQIDGNIIGPKLMGNSLSLNPIWIIFAITVGGSYFGIVGMFLSVPVAAIIKLLIANFMDVREKTGE